jgi:hypothetical protein
MGCFPSSASTLRRFAPRRQPYPIARACSLFTGPRTRIAALRTQSRVDGPVTRVVLRSTCVVLACGHGHFLPEPRNCAAASRRNLRANARCTASAGLYGPYLWAQGFPWPKTLRTQHKTHRQRMLSPLRETSPHRACAWRDLLALSTDRAQRSVDAELQTPRGRSQASTSHRDGSRAGVVECSTKAPTNVCSPVPRVRTSVRAFARIGRIGQSKVFLHRRIRNESARCQANSQRSFHGLILPFEACSDHIAARTVSRTCDPTAGYRRSPLRFRVPLAQFSYPSTVFTVPPCEGSEDTSSGAMSIRCRSVVSW